MDSWPKKGREPYRKYRCPECRVEFIGASVIRDGRSGKVCPGGHFHTLAQIYFFEKTGTLRVQRKPKTPKPARPAAPSCRANLIVAARKVGAINDRDRYQLAAAAMLAGFDRAMATLPPGARLLVEGAFGSAPNITRAIVEGVK